MFWIYWLILAYVFIFALLDVREEKDLWKQITAVLVLIPFLLRLLLIK